MTRPRIATLAPRVQTLQGATLGRAPVERERGTTNRNTRARHFKANPLCVACEREGRASLATQLDHIIPLSSGGTNADANRQGLCDEHHALKSAEEQGKTYTPKWSR